MAAQSLDREGCRPCPAKGRRKSLDDVLSLYSSVRSKEIFPLSAETECIQIFSLYYSYSVSANETPEILFLKSYFKMVQQLANSVLVLEFPSPSYVETGFNSLAAEG